MPIDRYDEFFGGEKGAAKRALQAMKKTYGTKDGEHVFWGKVAKEKRRGRAQRRAAKKR